MNGGFRPIKRSDVEYLATRLRAPDVAEVQALYGNDCDLLRLLLASVRTSANAFTGIAPDGEPIALVGVTTVSLLEGVGTPWMLGSERTYDFPRAFLSEGKRLMARMLGSYSLLRNHVDARNTVSIRWLRHVGYTILPAKPYGRFGLPFHPFEIRRPGYAYPASGAVSSGGITEVGS